MRIHKDYPFTEEEIMTFKAMLYQVNTSNHCVNPRTAVLGQRVPVVAFLRIFGL